MLAAAFLEHPSPKINKEVLLQYRHTADQHEPGHY
jgi:hypothetical protein